MRKSGWKSRWKSGRKQTRKRCIGAAIASWLIASSPCQASAITPADTALDTPESLESIRARLTNLERLPLFLPADQGTLNAADEQLSPTQLSQPSFAWIRDQVATRYDSTTIPIEIVSQWQAYTTHEGLQYVDVIVNKSRWEQLNYLRRYGFAVQFGTVARSYGYQLRIFHTGDAANHNDALSSAAFDRETNTRTLVGGSIRLRGAYFCTANTALPTCSTFIAP